MKIVDSHCHIDDERFDSDREELISLFEENEIDFLIDPASDVNSGRKILELVKNYDKIYGAFGILQN